MYSWNGSLEDHETVETKQVIDVKPFYGKHQDPVKIP
jgi:hypothetical protein